MSANAVQVPATKCSQPVSENPVTKINMLVQENSRLKKMLEKLIHKSDNFELTFQKKLDRIRSKSKAKRNNAHPEKEKHEGEQPNRQIVGENNRKSYDDRVRAQNRILQNNNYLSSQTSIQEQTKTSKRDSLPDNIRNFEKANKENTKDAYLQKRETIKQPPDNKMVRVTVIEEIDDNKKMYNMKKGEKQEAKGWVKTRASTRQNSELAPPQNNKKRAVYQLQMNENIVTKNAHRSTQPIQRQVRGRSPQFSPRLSNTVYTRQ